jgi:hypothetical protein
MPLDYQGCYTHSFYVYNERRPMLGIDVRDLPGLVEIVGRENLEVLQDDGTMLPLAESKPAPAPAPKPKAKPVKKQDDEVSDGD